MTLKSRLLNWLGCCAVCGARLKPLRLFWICSVCGVKLCGICGAWNYKCPVCGKKEII